MQRLLGHHWHHLPAAEAAQLLEVNVETGLDRFEVQHRRARFGPNQLTPAKPRSAWVRFLAQLHHPLVYVLLGAALLKLGMGDLVDAGVIAGVILLNAVVGWLQESRAERAIQALARSLVTEARVLRAGRVQQLPAAELVPGDIVLLASGDRVPADLRLVSTRDLQVAESALTGESAAVHKAAEAVLAPETPLADRCTMAYASTLVIYGQGRGLVVAIGDNTEIGRISEMISSVPSLETPLTRKMARFSRQLLIGILALAAVVVALGWLRGQAMADTISLAVALAVGAIPEGLPAAVTVTLAIGVSRMARRHAIIRKLPAVETLGSTTVICSDKTGTLTQNQMTVQRIVVGERVIEVSGSGYAPEGGLSAAGEPLRLADAEGVAECLVAGLLCNDSALIKTGEAYQAQGDPTEVALIVAARKAGLDPEEVSRRWPRVDAIPFESQHKFMATRHRGGSPGAGPAERIYLKGAVEVILERCAEACGADGSPAPLSPERVLAQVEALASAGMRVLAFARAAAAEAGAPLTVHTLPRDCTFLGLQGMIDPPRPEAVTAVAACHQAGVRVAMITGDHAGTAVAIARQLGLPADGGPGEGRPAVLTGRELAALSDDGLIEAAEETSVFARVSPEQKLRLVEALQARGHVVAMTGDGVNDGPALKQADIGIAMGIAGTEVAKEAADMVLTDDNFASIEAAVEEGRNVFDNLTKIIAWALPTNVGQGLVILAAALLGVPPPILPIQILWINMTTAGALGLFLALEPKEPGIMRRPPRRPDAPLLAGRVVARVLLVGACILLAAFGLFEWELARGASMEQARTVTANVVASVQAFYLLNGRSLRFSLLRLGAFTNPWVPAGIGLMAALQLLFTHAPFMQALFGTAPLGVAEWVRILGAGVAVFLLVEAEKAIRTRGPSGG